MQSIVWYKPRELHRYLQQSPSSHFRLMGILSLVYFIQAGIFILSLEKFTIAPLFGWEGLKLIVWFFLAVGFKFFVIVYLLTLTIWGATHCFQGQGTLPQTRGAVLMAFLFILPANLFLSLLYFAFRNPELTSLSPFLRTLSLIGMPLALIYGLSVLIKAVAEIHHVGLWQALFSTALGLLLSLTILWSGRTFLF